MVLGSSQVFERELEVFRTEVEGGAQYFYCYRAFHEIAKRRKSVLAMFNENPMFWNTVTGGVQTAAIIALGRIFDQQSAHNIDVLIRYAHRDLSIFSRASLGKRKQGTAANPPLWLTEYLQDAYEPTNDDFRNLRKRIGTYRKIYEDNYRDLRDKYYAHKEVADQASLGALVAKTNIKEMQRLFVFLLQLHQALWELYNNGTKPIFRPLRYSAQRMAQKPRTATQFAAVHESIMTQAERALLTLVKMPATKPPTRRR